jgi:hypothetical protein
MKDTGVKMLKRAKEFNFIKWGEYMKRANLAERKVQKLKELLLLTDPIVGHVAMNDLTKTQWVEFIKCFPDEK